MSCSCECAGVVTDVGADVRGLKPGDRVVAMAPGSFASYERLPHWAVCKLQDEEGYTVTQIPNRPLNDYTLIHRVDCVDNPNSILNGFVCIKVPG